MRIGDGGGLYLQIATGNTKSWLFRYTLHGKTREMGLGPVAEAPDGVPVAKARALASAARALLRDGKDPIDARRAGREARRQTAAGARERTFKAAAMALVESKGVGWRNAKHGAQWLATLEAYAYPVMGDMPVSAIGTDEVLRVLRPIRQRVPETASRVRQRVEAVLDAARVKGWRTGDNPARWKGHLAGELPPPRKVKRVQHRPALPWEQMGAFMAALATRAGTAAQALRFVILTAARTGEARGTRWRGINGEGSVWVVPGERMKAGVTHRVPVSAAALAVLAEVRPMTRGPNSLVFPSTRKTVPLSDVALSEVVRRMNEVTQDETPPWRDRERRPLVPHGLRSTFRDWAGETRPKAGR